MLSQDSDTLLETKEILAGTATLNWDSRLPVEHWDGVRVEGSRVVQLFLRKRQLTGVIPPQIGRLSALKLLVLDKNALKGEIPAAVGRLDRLEELWLKSNQLTGSIPPELGNLFRLRKLSLINNKLTGTIPSSLGNLSNLQELWLGNNQLSGHIPSDLGRLMALEELWLRNCQLTGSIPQEVLDLPNLLRLEIDNNEIYGEVPDRFSKGKKQGQSKKSRRGPETDEGRGGTKAKKRKAERKYRKEHSPKWEARDLNATEFFVYILKLNGGVFYAGQTRELRERLMEHRDGDTKSTAGKDPRLVWFKIVPSREEAEELEVEMKVMCDKNPREIRRKIRQFRDLVEQLEYD